MVSARLRRMRRMDAEDLIGDDNDAPAKKRDYDGGEEDKLSFSSVDAGMIQNGVSVQWLAKAFRVTRHVVEKKLVGVKPIQKGRYNNPLYDLPEAASYLIEPKVNIKKYLETVKTDKLPDHLRDSIWSARIKQQRWEEKAGDLWRTQPIIEKFGEVLIGIREKMTQIPDKLERLTGLSIAQYKMIRNTIDEVQDEISADILKLAKEGFTPNQANETDDDGEASFEEEIMEKRGPGRPRKGREDLA